MLRHVHKTEVELVLSDCTKLCFELSQYGVDVVQALLDVERFKDR